MSEPNTNPGAVPPQPNAEVRADAQPPVTSPSEPSTDEPVLSKRELVEARKEIRESNKLMQQVLSKLNGQPSEPPKPTTQTAAASPRDDVAELRAEMALEKALSANGVTDPKQRARIERMWKAERPTDVGTWLGDVSTEFGFGARAAPPAPSTPTQPVTPPPPPKGRSDTGAPGGSPTTSATQDLNNITAEALRHLPRDERMKVYEQRRAQHSRDHNPWAKPRS